MGFTFDTEAIMARREEIADGLVAEINEDARFSARRNELGTGGVIVLDRGHRVARLKVKDIVILCNPAGYSSRRREYKIGGRTIPEMAKAVINGLIPVAECMAADRKAEAAREARSAARKARNEQRSAEISYALGRQIKAREGVVNPDEVLLTLTPAEFDRVVAALRGDTEPVENAYTRLKDVVA